MPVFGIAILVLAVIFGGVFLFKRSSSGNDEPNSPGISTPKTTISTSTNQVSVSSPVTVPAIPRPTVDQIKSDLLGKYIGESWYFAALREFLEFNINNVSDKGDILEYDVSMRLKDYDSQLIYQAKVLIVYKKANDVWQFISVSGTCTPE